MKLMTRDFDEVEINESDIVKFESPIIGFDEYREFVFLFEDSFGYEIAWLQSKDEPGLCFILANAALVKNGYSFNIPENAQEILGNGEYDVWLVMVVAENVQKSTVNLRSPVLVNPANHKAAQFLLEEDLPIRYPLFEKERMD